MPTEQEKAQELYDKLKVEAQAVYIDHIVSRTPPELQDEVRAIAEADMGGTTDPTVASISNGQSVTVNDSTGAAAAGSPGTAAVLDGALTNVTLGPVAQRAGQTQGSGVRTGTINPRR